MKRLLVLALVMAVLAATACSKSNEVRQAEEKTVATQQDLYAKVHPIPFFDYSQDRATFIQIYRAKNEARTTYAVVASITGQILFTCPSIGFPIPADTQLSNPLQFVGNGVTIEQAEPNGLFSSKNTDATYILCVRDDGSVAPIYTENKVTTFPFPVRIENGMMVDAKESSSITINVKR